MENHNQLLSQVKAHPAIHGFIGVCVVLILIILSNQHTDTRVLSSDIFLRDTVIQIDER